MRVDLPGEKWSVFLDDHADGYTEGELAQLIASATAARALIRDLNRAEVTA